MWRTKSDCDPTKFSLGQIVATPAALRAIESSGQSPADFVRRHAAQDWGDLDKEDKQLNDQAVQDGSRILSAYHTSNGTKVWIITTRKIAAASVCPRRYCYPTNIEKWIDFDDKNNLTGLSIAEVMLKPLSLVRNVGNVGRRATVLQKLILRYSSRKGPWIGHPRTI